MTTTMARSLDDQITGSVHLPADPGYDDHRQALLPGLDPRPALVVQAHSADDVRAAVVAAGRSGLTPTIQATGHGTYAPADGMLIKTTAMDNVEIDAARRIARVGPGALWGAVLDATAPVGLAPLSGSSRTVGVTGFTLGGGMGWLSRLHGFASDSVLSAQAVTADGVQVTASAEQNPELFWALRGGGGSFGVVTALEFELYPVESVYAGISWFPIERAGDILTSYGAWIREIPDELSTALNLGRIPDAPQVPEQLRGRRAVAVKVLFAGAAPEAERLLQPIREAAGPALVDGYATMPYADAAMGGTPSRYLDFFGDSVEDGLSEAVAAAVVEIAGGGEDEGPTIEIRHYGGAIARQFVEAGPAGGRQAPLSIIVDDADAAAPLRPHGRGETFLNFLADTTRTAAAFTAADYQRLREVKRQVDPGNLFATGHVIPPA